MKKILLLISVGLVLFGACKKKCGSGTLFFKNLTTENIKVTVGSDIPSGCESVLPDGSCETTLPSEGDSVHYKVVGLTSAKITENNVYIPDCVTHTINIH